MYAPFEILQYFSLYIYNMSVSFLTHKRQLVRWATSRLVHTRFCPMCLHLRVYMFVRRMQELLLTEQTAAAYTVSGLCAHAHINGIWNLSGPTSILMIAPISHCLNQVYCITQEDARHSYSLSVCLVLTVIMKPRYEVTTVHSGAFMMSFLSTLQMQSFFSRMQEHYVSMPTVQDEWFPNQSMSYVNLALAPFRLGSQQAQERFVQAVKEGADNVYTYRTSKVECEAIPGLVKERKFVVLSGAPGVGKSTLARKVCQDVCRSPNYHGYSLVLLVELRKLLHFREDFQLVDILQLFEGMMGDATSSEELSKAIHRNLGKSVLFILDGFDELPPHLRQSEFLADLLSHNLECCAPLPYCHVVMTSRSIVTSEIYHSVRGSLTNIEVLGFTQDQIKEYAGHILVDAEKPDLLESFLRKIDSVPQVRGLCSIPVVLSIICQVFSFKEDLPLTLTGIYNEYMCVKVLKYHEDLTSLDSILDLSRDHDFYKLGKIAFDCIQSQKMVFQLSDLQGLGERFSDRIKGCGVLTARPVLADPKSKKAAIESYYFIHLTVQEFIAAVYVSLLPAEEQREIWSKYLGEPHMAQVWRFFCGLTGLTNYELLQANITGYPEDFQMQCLFESQNTSLVQKLMPLIVGEEVEVKPKTAYDSTAYGYCLSNHPALKELTIETQEGGTGSVEIHRLLEPVFASGPLQTLCLCNLGEGYSFYPVILHTLLGVTAIFD